MSDKVNQLAISARLLKADNEFGQTYDSACSLN